MSEKRPPNETYWAYNLPLQVWPIHKDPDDESSPIVGTNILNYMARKNQCCEMELDEELQEETREEFFLHAAKILENLAALMRKAAADPGFHVYYPDATPDAKEPS